VWGRGGWSLVGCVSVARFGPASHYVQRTLDCGTRGGRHDRNCNVSTGNRTQTFSSWTPRRFVQGRGEEGQPENLLNGRTIM
jgi:hypothetical protein